MAERITKLDPQAVDFFQEYARYLSSALGEVINLGKETPVLTLQEAIEISGKKRNDVLGINANDLATEIVVPHKMIIDSMNECISLPVPGFNPTELALEAGIFVLARALVQTAMGGGSDDEVLDEVLLNARQRWNKNRQGTLSF